MKNVIITIILAISLLCASLIFGTNAVADTKNKVILTIPEDPVYVIKELPNGKRIIFEYDGPGGKIINVWVEGNDKP
jgi:hypothetical protein